LIKFQRSQPPRIGSKKASLGLHSTNLLEKHAPLHGLSPLLALCRQVQQLMAVRA
jgi:hypothetical protein